MINVIRQKLVLARINREESVKLTTPELRYLLGSLDAAVGSLKPFARAGKMVTDRANGDTIVWGREDRKTGDRAVVTIADLRHARNVMGVTLGIKVHTK